MPPRSFLPDPSAPNLGVGQFMRPGARPFTADQVQAENTAQTYAAKLFASHPAGSFGAKSVGPVAGGVELHASIGKTLRAFTTGNAQVLGDFQRGNAATLGALQQGSRDLTKQFLAHGTSDANTGTKGYHGFTTGPSLHDSITKTLEGFKASNAKTLNGFRSSNDKTLKGFITSNAKTLAGFAASNAKALTGFIKSNAARLAGFVKGNAATLQGFQKGNAQLGADFQRGVREVQAQFEAKGTSTHNTGTKGYNGYTTPQGLHEANAQTLNTARTQSDALHAGGTSTKSTAATPRSAASTINHQTSTINTLTPTRVNRARAFMVAPFKHPPGWGFPSPAMRAEEHWHRANALTPL